MQSREEIGVNGGLRFMQGGAPQGGFSCGFAAIHLLPHPAGCKFIGSINLVGEAIGLPHYGLMDAWATTGRPYGYTIASDLQTAG